MIPFNIIKTYLPLYSIRTMSHHGRQSVEISSLKQGFPLIYNEVLKEQIKAGNCPNDDLLLVQGPVQGNFKWVDSKLGVTFWEYLDDLNFEKAYYLKPEMFLSYNSLHFNPMYTLYSINNLVFKNNLT